MNDGFTIPLLTHNLPDEQITAKIAGKIVILILTSLNRLSAIFLVIPLFVLIIIYHLFDFFLRGSNHLLTNTPSLAKVA